MLTGRKYRLFHENDKVKAPYKQGKDIWRRLIQSEVWDELPELNEWERLYFERHIRCMAEQDEKITV
jgi:hypothetical protein